jgi:hypothetical protein
MNFKTRLKRLEAKKPNDTKHFIINRFFVCPRHDDDETIGYKSACGITTLRLLGESLVDLRRRCGELPIQTNRRLFDPLFKNDLKA